MPSKKITIRIRDGRLYANRPGRCHNLARVHQVPQRCRIKPLMVDELPICIKPNMHTISIRSRLPCDDQRKPINPWTARSRNPGDAIAPRRYQSMSTFRYQYTFASIFNILPSLTQIRLWRSRIPPIFFQNS